MTHKLVALLQGPWICDGATETLSRDSAIYVEMLPRGAASRVGPLAPKSTRTQLQPLASCKTLAKHKAGARAEIVLRLLNRHSRRNSDPFNNGSHSAGIAAGPFLSHRTRSPPLAPVPSLRSARVDQRSAHAHQSPR